MTVRSFVAILLEAAVGLLLLACSTPSLHAALDRLPARSKEVSSPAPAKGRAADPAGGEAAASDTAKAAAPSATSEKASPASAPSGTTSPASAPSGGGSPASAPSAGPSTAKQAAIPGFAELLEKARKDTTTKDGTVYDLDIGRQFAKEHKDEVSDCVRSRIPAPPYPPITFVLVVDEEGAVAQVMANSATDAAACILQILTKEKFKTKPPFAPFHDLMEMTFD